MLATEVERRCNQVDWSVGWEHKDWTALKTMMWVDDLRQFTNGVIGNLDIDGIDATRIVAESAVVHLFASDGSYERAMDLAWNADMAMAWIILHVQRARITINYETGVCKYQATRAS